MKPLEYNTNALQALAAYLRGERLPHALLIEAPAGCGKSSFARYVAAGALCTAEPPQRPCGACRDCMKVQKEVHPDVLTWTGDGGSLSFHVDKVRALRQEAYIRAGEGRCKVLILEDVQEMTPSASNALLKVLEEPPTGVVFVLTCNNRAALLDTILSRVATITLRCPSPEQCAGALEARFPDTDPGRLQELAQRAGGSIGIALQMLEEEVGTDSALSLLEQLCLGSELDILAALSRFEQDKEGLSLLLDSLAAQVRLLLTPAAGEMDTANRLRKRISPLQLMQILDIIEACGDMVVRNVHRALLITNLCAQVRSVLAN